jgi:hypothetical protein
VYLGAVAPSSVGNPPGNRSTAITAEAGLPRFAQLQKVAPELNPQALRAGLAALQKLERAGAKVRSDVLAIIDYSIPSSERRFWVFDLQHDQLLFHELVAHGKNSGANLATRFSNAPGSLMTSLGVFVTGNSYMGEHGLALRLNGLDKGENDNSLSRAIVIHGAWYVSESLAQKTGQIGRSWGCPAVRPEISSKLIHTLEDGAVLLAYFPNRV